MLRATAPTWIEHDSLYILRETPHAASIAGTTDRRSDS
jgi:hypothetical protein